MRKPSRHVLLEMLVNHGVEYVFGNPGMEFFQHPLDCASVAEAFGVQGFKVDDPADLKPTLEKVFSLGKPALVNIHIHSGEY